MKHPATYPWIVVNDGTKGELAYAPKCLRCGAVQKIALPISVKCFFAMAKAFEWEHRRCKEATE